MTKLLSKCRVTAPHFQGVYNADEIPWEKKRQRFNQKSFFIFNLADSDKEGTHWICIMLSGYREPFYFDSYGIEPSNPDFEKFMNYSYKCNGKRLQHPTSTNCGQWCMYFVYHMSQNRPFQCLLNRFNGTTLHNDYVLSKCIRRIFNIDVWPLDLLYFKNRLRNEIRRGEITPELVKVFLTQSLRGTQLEDIKVAQARGSGLRLR